MSMRNRFQLAPLIGSVLIVGCGGGATFKFAETPWSGEDANMQRLERGAEKLGCSTTGPDSTGELEIVCPEGKPNADAEAGSIRIGPDSEDKLLAMCNDGLAEGCTKVLEQIWAAGE